MSSIQRISDAEWERHKAEIQRLYIKNDRTREDVMAIMRERHGFLASKEQYVRRFKKWKLSKNISDVNWAVVGYKVGKRRNNGKESEVYHKGKLVLDKKARKEMSRHSCSVWDQYSNNAASPATPEDMVVCTPKGQCPVEITFRTVPWFRFQERFNFGSQFAFGLDDLNRSPASLRISRTCTDEDLPISAPVMPNLPVSHLRDAPPTTLDIADVLGDHEHQRNFPFERQPSDVSSARTAVELAHATIFMSSNNNLLYDDTDRFVKSIVDNKMHWVLKTILAHRTPTTEILANNLLIVASQYDDVRMVGLLLYMGADVNARKRFPVDSSTVTDLMGPLPVAIQYGRLAIARRLVEGGAKLSLDHGFDQRYDLMEILASPENNKMVLTLLEKGMDVRRSPILAFAVASGNIELTKTLLSLGAFNAQWRIPCDDDLFRLRGLGHVKRKRMKICYATPLQIAAENNNLMMVNALLGGDSDVNVPESSRLFIDHFWFDYLAELCCTAYISPLVHAASNGNIEMTEALLKAGANINSCVGHEYYHILSEIETSLCETDEREHDSTRSQFLWLLTSTALQIAAFQENLKLVQFLLEAGAVVDMYGCAVVDTYGCAVVGTYGYGHTALQIAVKRNNTPLTSLLLAYGANVDAPAHGPFGRTALQNASENGNIALFQLLLARSRSPKT